MFGAILSAGHETKALLNNNGPRYKRSKLERQMNADVLWCVLILLIMCLFSAIGKCSSLVETLLFKLNITLSWDSCM